MISQLIAPVSAALISAAATLIAARISADSSPKGSGPISTFICSSSNNALQQSRLAEDNLQSQLEAKISENISLKEELSSLSLKIEQMSQNRIQTDRAERKGQSSQASLTQAQSIQSGEFRVSPGIPKPLFKGEILLETEKIYQGENPRINYVAFTLDYQSSNIPDRSGLRVSARSSVDFMHRGRRYRLLSGQIVTEDNSATLVLRPID